jgi:hypothetical protein
LCLDTCVFLDVITTGNRGQADLIGVNRDLLEVLVHTPGRLQLVINDLVLHEWGQRKEEVRGDARKWLVDTDRHIQQIHEAWTQLGNPLPASPPKYNDPQLIDVLTDLAQGLLDQALVLREDVDCVMRALGRVKAKARPSHNKQIKDSIHLEHYLELSRQLRDAGHREERIFVSTNSSDFWADKNNAEHPHPDLAHDRNAASLLFLGRLPLALRRLGILGSSGGAGP